MESRSEREKGEQGRVTGGRNLSSLMSATISNCSHSLQKELKSGTGCRHVFTRCIFVTILRVVNSLAVFAFLKKPPDVTNISQGFTLYSHYIL